MTALIILIALIVIIADELNIRKKRCNNQAAAQKRVNECLYAEIERYPGKGS